MAHIETFTPESLEELAALLLAADGRPGPIMEGPTCELRVSGVAGLTAIRVRLDRVAELNRLEHEERGGLRAGAAVSLGMLQGFLPITRWYPILADALEADSRPVPATTLGEVLGGPEAAPATLLALLCLRARAAVFGPYGWSEAEVEGLVPGVGRGGCQPGEFVVDIRVPAPPPRTSGASARGLPAEGGPQAVAVLLAMEEDGRTCCGARLAAWAGGASPRRSLEAERLLAGRVLDPAGLSEAAHLAARAPEEGRAGTPPADLLGLTGLAHRALTRAWERVRQGSDG